MSWRQRTAASWAGFRGAVSLAAVLAVPVSIGGGAAFPDRDLLVFVTCVVILLTIVVQGTTLPAVVRWAGFPEDTARTDEVRLAQGRATAAALGALPELARQLGVDDEQRDQVRAELERHAQEVTGDDPDDTPGLDRNRRLRLKIIETKRRVVTDLRDANEIDDIVLREVQASLDLGEVRLLGPPPSNL